jgi:two-component system, cell cycle sensor histidine kinase and response regulator CckA
LDSFLHCEPTVLEYGNIAPRIKILLSSGYSMDGEAKEIMSRGCNGFIQKPYRLDDLSRKLREILSQ